MYVTLVTVSRDKPEVHPKYPGSSSIPAQPYRAPFYKHPASAAQHSIYMGISLQLTNYTLFDSWKRRRTSHDAAGEHFLGTVRQVVTERRCLHQPKGTAPWMLLSNLTGLSAAQIVPNTKDVIASSA